MQLIPGLIVTAYGLCLIGFTGVIITHPKRAERFLKAFASSARAHFTEQALRLVTGSALVAFAPSMWFSQWFAILGWLIIVTTVGLLVLPWHWHRTFSLWVMPSVIRHARLLALGCFALGVFVVHGVSRVAFG